MTRQFTRPQVFQGYLYSTIEALKTVYWLHNSTRQTHKWQVKILLKSLRFEIKQLGITQSGSMNRNDKRSSLLPVLTHVGEDPLKNKHYVSEDN